MSASASRDSDSKPPLTVVELRYLDSARKQIFGYFADVLFPERVTDQLDLIADGLPRLLSEVRALRAEADSTREPDYYYDPEHWDCTYDVHNRDMVHGEGDGINAGDVMRVCTLRTGPDRWVVNLMGTDEQCNRVAWFDTEAEARAAIASWLSTPQRSTP